jgi:hypothetical protein
MTALGGGGRAGDGPKKRERAGSDGSQRKGAVPEAAMLKSNVKCAAATLPCPWSSPAKPTEARHTQHPPLGLHKTHVHEVATAMFFNHTAKIFKNITHMCFKYRQIAGTAAASHTRAILSYLVA